MTNGQIELGVIVIDAFSGNASPVSNPVNLTIVSVTSDYNGDSYSDAALYSRSTVTFTGTLTSGSALAHKPQQSDWADHRSAHHWNWHPVWDDDRVPSTTWALPARWRSARRSGHGHQQFDRVVRRGEHCRPWYSVRDDDSDRRQLEYHALAERNGRRLQSLTATAVTLSAAATASGSQSLTANPGVWLVQATSVGPANPAPFWFTSGMAFGPSNATPFQGDFDGDGLT